MASHQEKHSITISTGLLGIEVKETSSRSLNVTAEASSREQAIKWLRGFINNLDRDLRELEVPSESANSV